MSKKQYLRKTGEWIALLSSKSSDIANLGLENSVAIDRDLNTIAFNLSNSDEHNQLVVRATEKLISSQAATQSVVRQLLSNMIGSNTYGSFCELAAYDWIMQRQVAIKTQISLVPNEVLGTKGAVLDGRLEYVWEVYFDVKAFGFTGYMAERLKQRLQVELPGLQVFVSESWDLAYDEFQTLIEDAATIANELRQKGVVQRGRVQMSAGPPRPVTVSMIIHQPYLLAKENACFPFLSANQFTRTKPFLLIYVIHPWLNRLAIDNDFAHGDSTFTRALARRAFMQFSSDTSSLDRYCRQVNSSATLADASRLLSAIMFMNVWPSDLYEAGTPENNPKPSWLYLNPRAANILRHAHVHVLEEGFRLFVDDFLHDDY